MCNNHARLTVACAIAGQALLISSILAEGPAPSVDADFVAETDEHLVRLGGFGFSGVVLIARDGEILLAKGYGLADRGEGIPWTPATVSTIGSITKQFTGAAFLLLQEQGRLSVGDPITKYFDGVPADKQEITLHQLLTHSSGIVDLRGADDWDPIGREEFIERILDQPLAFEPGEDYRYSNAGYSLLGAIIEKLSGSSYEAFVRERLFLPHGLYETGYVLPEWGDERMAQGYRGNDRWGTVLERPLAEDGPFWVLRANGGIHTTAYDMLRWAEALTGGKVLSPASLDQYWAPHVDEGGGETFYGYGWSIATTGGVKVVTHNGGNGIFMADMAIVPAAGLVLFMQTNVRADSDDAPMLLQRMGERLFGGQPYADVPQVVDVDPGVVSGLAGEFRTAEQDTLIVTADKGALLVEANGSKAFSSLHSTEATYDAARVERFDDRIAAIVGAYVNGDFGPLHEAYGRRVTVDYLKDRYAERRSAAEAEHGPLQGFEILGTALRGTRRDYTVVRFHFERGHEDQAYVFHGEESEKLLGVSIRGLPPVVRFLPVGDREFASWDARTGASKALVFERAGDRPLALRVGSGENALKAQRPHRVAVQE